MHIDLIYLYFLAAFFQYVVVHYYKIYVFTAKNGNINITQTYIVREQKSLPSSGQLDNMGVIFCSTLLHQYINI